MASAAVKPATRVLNAVAQGIKIVARLAIVFKAFEHRRDQVDFAQSIGQTAGDALLHLQTTAQEADRQIGHKSKGARGPGQLLVVAGCHRTAAWGRREPAACQVVESGAGHVREDKAYVSPECRVECLQAFAAALHLGC